MRASRRRARPPRRWRFSALQCATARARSDAAAFPALVGHALPHLPGRLARRPPSPSRVAMMLWVRTPYVTEAVRSRRPADRASITGTTSATTGSTASTATTRRRDRRTRACRRRRVCMNCHSQVWQEAARLAPVRASWFDGRRRFAGGGSISSPSFVYFDHSAHVSHGVGCVECHGRVDPMGRVYAVAPLTMQWCLDCHRDPGAAPAPASEITNMDWRRGPAPRRRRAGAELASRRSTARACHRSRRCTELPWRGRREAAPADRRPISARAPTPRRRLTRRELLMLLGASAALAGADGCSRGQARAHRPVRRPAAGGDAGYRALRDDDDARRVRHRPRRREPRGAPDEGRGQPAAPREPRRARHLRASERPLDLRPRARRASSRATGRARDVARAPRRARSTARPRRREAHPRAPRTDERPARRRRSSRACAPQGVVVHFDAPLARAAAWAGARLAFGRVARAALGLLARRRRPRARRRLPRGRGDAPRRGRAAWAERRRLEPPGERDEPALRRRAAAHGDGHERRRAARACRRARSAGSPRPSLAALATAARRRARRACARRAPRSAGRYAVGAGRRARPARARRREPRRRRRRAAARGARARARRERAPRQRRARR